MNPKLNLILKNYIIIKSNFNKTVKNGYLRLNKLKKTELNYY